MGHSWAQTRTKLREEIDNIRNSGVYKVERIITSEQNSWISIQGKKEKVLNFCANNYLGLSVRNVPSFGMSELIKKIQRIIVILFFCH